MRHWTATSWYNWQAKLRRKKKWSKLSVTNNMNCQKQNSPPSCPPRGSILSELAGQSPCRGETYHSSCCCYATIRGLPTGCARLLRWCVSTQHNFCTTNNRRKLSQAGTAAHQSSVWLSSSEQDDVMRDIYSNLIGSFSPSASSSFAGFLPQIAPRSQSALNNQIFILDGRRVVIKMRQNRVIQRRCCLHHQGCPAKIWTSDVLSQTHQAVETLQ